MNYPTPTLIKPLPKTNISKHHRLAVSHIFLEIDNIKLRMCLLRSYQAETTNCLRVEFRPLNSATTNRTVGSNVSRADLLMQTIPAIEPMERCCGFDGYAVFLGLLGCDSVKPVKVP
jgi:hypothetical protein